MAICELASLLAIALESTHPHTQMFCVLPSPDPFVATLGAVASPSLKVGNTLPGKLVIYFSFQSPGISSWCHAPGHCLSSFSAAPKHPSIPHLSAP